MFKNKSANILYYYYLGTTTSLFSVILGALFVCGTPISFYYNQIVSNKESGALISKNTQIDDFF